MEDHKTFKDYNIKKNSNLRLIPKNISLEKQSDDNQKLKERIWELENELKKERNEKILLTNKIKKLEDYIKTIEKNKEKLESKSQISSKNDFNEELFNLMKQLRVKEEEIKELKSTMQFNLKPGEKLISIIFISVDQKIHHSLICKNTDIFTSVENLLYNEFPEYKETENYFILDGVKVNKYKSLEENKIKNSSIITLYIFE